MRPSRQSLRVVLADDHHFFREGLRGMLAADGISVVGEAANGEEAVSVAREQNPDVVVIDVKMPGGSGLDTVRRITSTHPGQAVIVLTVSTEPGEVIAALAAGASCYLPKDTRVEELLTGIRLAAAGHAVISREIVQMLAQLGNSAHPSSSLPRGETALTARELDVLRLLAQGADNATIGRELSISGHTVKQHVTSIFGKLDVQNRVQAAVCAVRAGLL